MSELTIRAFEEADWDGVWSIIEPVFASGETYAFPTDLDSAAAHQLWIELPLETFVAIDPQGRIAGTYYLKANAMGPGNHVCNCGYIVADFARGQGLAATLCQHSQTMAKERGFLAMQFNMVASSNEVAVRLWRKLGYAVVGTLPNAFRHPTQGLVDAYVMFKQLGS